MATLDYIPLYVELEPKEFGVFDPECAIFVNRWDMVMDGLAQPQPEWSDADRAAWEYYSYACGSPPPSLQNARVYWEMFGGLNPEGQEQHVVAVDIRLDYGGYFARYYDFYRFSVYGRATLNGPNLVTIHSQRLYTDGLMWKSQRISKNITNNDVRCVVIKVERTDLWGSTTSGNITHEFNDQNDEADPPPYGIRIKSAKVYGSERVKRNVRPHLILTDILDNGGFTYSGPHPEFVVEQMAFTESRKDRWEAIDEVNTLLGYDYWCYNGTTVVFQDPADGTVRPLSTDDPATDWSFTKDIDETFSAVRVEYGNKRGKPRDVIVHGDAAISIVRADTVQAPESVKTLKGAQRFGRRWLRDHKELQVTGSVTVVGDSGPLDAMLYRPGDRLKIGGPARGATGTQKVTRVTLNPLDWSATLEFGVNPKRLDRWLARLAVGTKGIKRR
jgi:hypothetical protein